MPSASSFRGTPRFEARSCLGAGGMGIVYEVLDRQLERRVALKTLRRMTPQALLRFKAEFRALRDIRHPNLVRLGELFEEGGQWFFTMELLEGAELLERLGRPAPELMTAPLSDLQTTEADYAALPGHTDPETLRQAFGQLFAALAALHAAGKIHRDVKPSNIWLTDDERVVLLDFGLAVSETYTSEELFGDDAAGTAAYMAPEQAAGLRVTQAADCYAAGVVLFEALTGRRPFVGSVRQVLVDKQHEPAPPTNELAAEVPADLARVVDALLERDPARRPTAAQVVRQLGSARALSRWVRDSRDLQPLGPSAELAKLIGRDRERARLFDLYDASQRTQRAYGVLMLGPEGSGKRTIVTSLVRELSREKSPPLVLRSRCVERERIPFQAVDGLMDDVCRALLGRDEDELVDIVAPLGHAFPQVAALLPPHTLTLRRKNRARAAHARDALLSSAERLFARLSVEQPVVLSIQDIHRVDDDSLELLSQLCWADEPLRLLLLGTIDAEQTNSARLELLSARLRAELLPLEPLRLDRARQLFAHVARGHGVAEREARALADELVLAPQQPLAISELARTAAAGGAERVVQSGGLPSLAAPAELLEDETLLEGDDDDLVTLEDAHFDELLTLEDADLEEVPDGPRLASIDTTPMRPSGAANVRALLQVRVAQLEGLSRLLLELLAVADEPVAATTLARAARVATADGADERDVASALAQLELDALIAPAVAGRFDTYELAQRSLIELVGAGLDEQRRQMLQAALLPQQGSYRFDPLALAVHLHRIGRVDDAAVLYERAGELALRALAFERAAELFGQASDLTRDETQRQRLMPRLAEAQIGCGRAEPAARALIAAASTARGAQRLDLRTAAAEQLLRAGQIDEAVEILHSVLAESGLSLPRTAPGAMMSLLARRARLHVGEQRAVEDDAELERAHRLIDTCWLAVSALGPIELARAADFQARHHAQALRVDDPFRRGRALAAEVTLLAGAPEQRDEAARTLEQIDALAATVDDDDQRAQLRALRHGAAAALALHDGRLGDAVELARRAAQQLAASDMASWHVENAQLVELWALSQLGETSTLGPLAQGGFRRARRRGDRRTMRDVIVGPSVIGWLADDQAAAATEALDALCADDEHVGEEGQLSWQSAYALWARVSVELYGGAARQAYTRLEAAWAALPPSLLLHVQTARVDYWDLRGRAALAALGQLRDSAAVSAALTIAEEAKVQLEAQGQPRASGLAAVLDSALAERAADVPRARAQLVEAITALEACEALLVATCARWQLALLDGDRASAEQATERLDALGVRAPAQMLSLLAPGARFISP